MARRPLTGRDRETADRARKVADRYFDLDSGGEEPEADHLDDGYAFDPPRPRKPRRAKPAAPAEPVQPLTDKQAQFVLEYCVDFNGTQAAIRAGFSAKSAARQAIELLHKTHVRRAIEDEQKRRAATAIWDADRVLARLGEELEADLLDIFTESGGIRPVKDWPLIWRKGGVLAGMKIKVLYDDEGDPIGEVIEIKTPVRTRQLELVGKHIDVLAFKDRGIPPDPEGGPLGQLLGELQGTSIRPKVIEGTATEKPKGNLPVTSGGLRPREGGG